jgi:hypothetical protein
MSQKLTFGLYVGKREEEGEGNLKRGQAFFLWFGTFGKE